MNGENFRLGKGAIDLPSRDAKAGVKVALCVLVNTNVKINSHFRFYMKNNEKSIHSRSSPLP